MTPSDKAVELAAQALFDRECARCVARGSEPHHKPGTLVKNMPHSYRDDYERDAIAMLSAAAPAMQASKAKIEHAIDHFEPDFIGELTSERETWIADNMRHEILTMVRRLPAMQEANAMPGREEIARRIYEAEYDGEAYPWEKERERGLYLSQADAVLTLFASVPAPQPDMDRIEAIKKLLHVTSPHDH